MTVGKEEDSFRHLDENRKRFDKDLTKFGKDSSFPLTRHGKATIIIFVR